jgi:hypothetical protein
MDHKGRKSGLSDWMALLLALAGFLLFLYFGQHSGSGIFARLLGP